MTLLLFFLYQKSFIAFLKSFLSLICKITYFSDGAGSQYKNRITTRKISGCLLNGTLLLLHMAKERVMELEVP